METWDLLDRVVVMEIVENLESRALVEPQDLWEAQEQLVLSDAKEDVGRVVPQDNEEPMVFQDAQASVDFLESKEQQEPQAVSDQQDERDQGDVQD